MWRRGRTARRWVSPSSSSSGPGFQHPAPAAVVDALEAEVDSIMRPSGLRFTWRKLRAVFFRASKCGQCHTFNGKGGTSAPDLSKADRRSRLTEKSSQSFGNAGIGVFNISRSAPLLHMMTFAGRWRLPHDPDHRRRSFCDAIDLGAEEPVSGRTRPHSARKASMGLMPRARIAGIPAARSATASNNSGARRNVTGSTGGTP